MPTLLKADEPNGLVRIIIEDHRYIEQGKHGRYRIHDCHFKTYENAFFFASGMLYCLDHHPDEIYLAQIEHITFETGADFDAHLEEQDAKT